MSKFSISLLLTIATLLVSSGQDAKPKEDLGFAYILPLPILTAENTTESEEIGALLPSTLLVDESCVPKRIRNAEGSANKPHTLRITNYRVSKPVLLNKANPSLIFHALGEENKPKFKWTIKPPASKEFLTIAFSNRENKEKWVDPKFITIDCSAKKIPEGSVLILNYSHNELHSLIGKEKHVIKAGEKKIFNASVTEKMALRVVAIKGKKKAFLFKNYVNNKGHRSVIVVYPKPTSGSFLKVAMTLAEIPIVPVLLP